MKQQSLREDEQDQFLIKKQSKYLLT